MNDLVEIARSFSGGKFEEVADKLADSVEWNIYEDSRHLLGKEQVLIFCRQVAAYFASVTTNFEEYGSLADHSKVTIYGHAEFIREGKIVNEVNSSDSYEFNREGKIQKIYSYCNSVKAS
jgi:hypothetical protein